MLRVRCGTTVGWHCSRVLHTILMLRCRHCSARHALQLGSRVERDAPVQQQQCSMLHSPTLASTPQDSTRPRAKLQRPRVARRAAATASRVLHIILMLRCRHRSAKHALQFGSRQQRAAPVQQRPRSSKMPHTPDSCVDASRLDTASGETTTPACRSASCRNRESRFSSSNASRSSRAASASCRICT